MLRTASPPKLGRCNAQIDRLLVVDLKLMHWLKKLSHVTSDTLRYKTFFGCTDRKNLFMLIQRWGYGPA